MDAGTNALDVLTGRVYLLKLGSIVVIVTSTAGRVWRTPWKVKLIFPVTTLPTRAFPIAIE